MFQSETMRTVAERLVAVCGINDEEAVARIPTADLVAVPYRWLGRIDEAWGTPVDCVFGFMGLGPAEAAVALELLMTDCLRQTQSFYKRYWESFDRARKVLHSSKSITQSPLVLDPVDFFDSLAQFLPTVGC